MREMPKALQLASSGSRPFITVRISGVAGAAWAQHTGVRAVEVQLDGGGWRPAVLASTPSDDTWVQWAVTLAVTPGPHQLKVRATDKGGVVQTGVRADAVPDGATGWHSVDFVAES